MAKNTSVSQKRAVSAHRRRLKRAGFTRLEVQVRKDDAALIRGLAKALADPAKQETTRALIREQLGAGQALGLKALLAAAPFEGIDLSRDRDRSRNVSL